MTQSTHESTAESSACRRTSALGTMLEAGVSLLTEQVDCNELFLCATQCECSENGCSYDPTGRRGSWGQRLVRREGDPLTGVFSEAAFLNERQLPVPLGTVRFSRVLDE